MQRRVTFFSTPSCHRFDAVPVIRRSCAFFLLLPALLLTQTAFSGPAESPKSAASQMSAWYIFSALGFYPVCPGDPNYIIGTPLFDKATIHLPNGENFSITARDNGPQHCYISGAELNGRAFNQTYLNHQDLTSGGELLFKMTSAPNYEWAVAPESRPRSALSTLTSPPGR